MTTIIEHSHISFGREICGDLSAGFRREWLVTNGIGGYASGTLIGISSRSYHGLLVAALQPPAGRTVLVGASVEYATYAGKRYWLSTNEYADGVLAPDGYRNLVMFRLEGTIPVWTYGFADVLLERRIWMAHGKNSTYVDYHLVTAGGPVELEITPLVTYRDHHALSSGQGWQMQVERQEHGATDRAFDDAAPLRLLSDDGEFKIGGRWYWNFRYREEAARGLPDHGDLYAPGSFHMRLDPGHVASVSYSIEPDVDLDSQSALAIERTRLRGVLTKANAERQRPEIQQLILAADQFIVSGSTGGEASGHGPTIIAGYPWFNDWGRDTMIALPGLTLTTGRFDDAEAIIRTFSEHIQNGLLPNNFADRDGIAPGYNTVDASLWFIEALQAFGDATGNNSLLKDLLPQVIGIIDAYRNGTRFGISVDPDDGLLRAGVPGVQLTWMDALVDGWVVTPRVGKPVEVNALWYNALRIAGIALERSSDPRSADFETEAARTRASFVSRFAAGNRGYLADVVDGPGGDDWSLRPNQLVAASLTFPIIEGEILRSMLETTSRTLLTSHGLRTLSVDDPSYVGKYEGDRKRRDGAYHQGTVWPWLLHAYAVAADRTDGDRERTRRLMEPIYEQLSDAGLGSISEIFDGDPPHVARGAIAQAWSVAALLRINELVERQPKT